MKITSFLLLLCTLFSVSTYAARFDIIGDVGKIRYHGATNSFAPRWSRHSWFEIINTDADSKINCSAYSSTSYAITIPDGNETALSMLLSAKMSGSKVMVTVDDTVVFPANSYCKIQYLTIL